MRIERALALVLLGALFACAPASAQNRAAPQPAKTKPAPPQPAPPPPPPPAPPKPAPPPKSAPPPKPAPPKPAPPPKKAANHPEDEAIIDQLELFMLLEMMKDYELLEDSER